MKRPHAGSNLPKTLCICTCRTSSKGKVYTLLLAPVLHKVLGFGRGQGRCRPHLPSTLSSACNKRSIREDASFLPTRGSCWYGRRCRVAGSTLHDCLWLYGTRDTLVSRTSSALQGVSCTLHNTGLAMYSWDAGAGLSQADSFSEGPSDSTSSEVGSCPLGVLGPVSARRGDSCERRSPGSVPFEFHIRLVVLFGCATTSLGAASAWAARTASKSVVMRGRPSSAPTSLENPALRALRQLGALRRCVRASAVVPVLGRAPAGRTSSANVLSASIAAAANENCASTCTSCTCRSSVS
eukprot:365723-Chlamydomonas_euryale.AAC.3